MQWTCKNDIDILATVIWLFSLMNMVYTVSNSVSCFLCSIPQTQNVQTDWWTSPSQKFSCVKVNNFCIYRLPSQICFFQKEMRRRNTSKVCWPLVNWYIKYYSGNVRKCYCVSGKVCDMEMFTIFMNIYESRKISASVNFIVYFYPCTV